MIETMRERGHLQSYRGHSARALRRSRRDWPSGRQQCTAV